MSKIEKLYSQLSTFPDAEPLIDQLYDFPDRNLLNTVFNGEMKNFCGSLYELFAHRRAEQLFRDSKVVSPSQMSDLYEYLFSNRGSRSGILGEVRPDGLVLTPGTNKNHKITALTEYKAVSQFSNPERFYPQLMRLVRQDSMASSFNMHDFIGRDRFAAYLREIIPGFDARSVSLDPKYQVCYVVPSNSEISMDYILDQPESFFSPPSVSKERNYSIKPEIIRRLRVERCDFDTPEFTGMVRMLTRAIYFDRQRSAGN